MVPMDFCSGSVTDNTRIIIQKNIDFGNYSIKFPVNEKSENIIVFFYFMV